MPRPQRIEYEHAFYHVMNRGRGRQTIFHGEAYFEAFLEGLSEAHQRFGCVVHAYCLMGNHYHLLIETPKANLSRVMRHVNGVYTQRYNRLKRTDGPLFRGRFKALLVDADAYLLQVSRYIHRNPLDMRRPLVTQLTDYPWSSYPAYVGHAQSPRWLERELIYRSLGKRQRQAGYADFVAQGVDEHTQSFYSKGNMTPLIGEPGFKDYVYEEVLPSLEAEAKVRAICPVIDIELIAAEVAQAYKTTIEELRAVVKGPRKGSEARKVAMYFCQEVGAVKLVEIARYFHLNHPGSVSYVTHQIRQRKREDAAFSKRTENLLKSIMKQAT